VDKGEVQGLCGIQWSSFAPSYSSWVTSGKVTVFGQITPQPGDPALNAMGVQNVWDVVKDPDRKKVLELIFNQENFGRPYLAPPGTPPERVAILRKAFDETMTDPRFLADAKRARLPINPTSGAELQAEVAKLYAVPDRLVEQARNALN
jgi:hypothetical protein